MNFSSYFEKNVTDGAIFTMVLEDLHKAKNFKNVLFVRTPATGRFMDTVILNKEINVKRVLYYKNRGLIDPTLINSYRVLRQERLESYIKSLNIQFDVICVDSFHEYYESSKDFSLLSSFLTDDGILISHDCYPPKKEWAYPKFCKGPWCGVTYIAFVEFAYNNPDYYYIIINNDTGIGIASKKQIDNLQTNLDRSGQERLLELHKANDDSMYDFFCKNSKEIINAITESPLGRG
jgi:hypothetical protein